MYHLTRDAQHIVYIVCCCCNSRRMLFFQNSGLASVIVALIQVVFTAIAALIMDKAGRKILLVISGTLVP